jgi:hypothetical protein
MYRIFGHGRARLEGRRAAPGRRRATAAGPLQPLAAAVPSKQPFADVPHWSPRAVALAAARRIGEPMHALLLSGSSSRLAWPRWPSGSRDCALLHRPASTRRPGLQAAAVCCRVAQTCHGVALPGEVPVRLPCQRRDTQASTRCRPAACRLRACQQWGFGIAL